MLAFAVLYLNVVWQDETLCIPCKEQRPVWLSLQACAQHQLVISEFVQPDKDLSNLHNQVQLAMYQADGQALKGTCCADLQAAEKGLHNREVCWTIPFCSYPLSCVSRAWRQLQAERQVSLGLERLHAPSKPHTEILDLPCASAVATRLSMPGSPLAAAEQVEPSKTRGEQRLQSLH